MSLFDTGIRPIVDKYLLDEATKERDYGNYWSASSAGYCYRRLIFGRLKIPHVAEDARKQRVFSVGHIFHSWLQDITKEAGLSIAQELELQDEELMIRGHIDDLVLVELNLNVGGVVNPDDGKMYPFENPKQLILYDYKTAHSRSFTYSKGRPMSYYHKIQLGTYMYMLRKWVWPKLVNSKTGEETLLEPKSELAKYDLTSLTEARILSISKDDLRMEEKQLLWSEELSNEIEAYWAGLNQAWAAYNRTGELPPCTCHEYENGFMAKEAWNPYWYAGEPCSVNWFNKFKEESDG